MKIFILIFVFLEIKEDGIIRVLGPYNLANFLPTFPNLVVPPPFLLRCALRPEGKQTSTGSREQKK